MKHKLKRVFPWTDCAKAYKVGRSGGVERPCRRCWALGVFRAWRGRIKLLAAKGGRNGA